VAVVFYKFLTSRFVKVNFRVADHTGTDSVTFGTSDRPGHLYDDATYRS
jgi:hypothetical protein